MGVHGLWKLLESTGRPVSLDTLEGKVLAVDVSIWLNQAMYGMYNNQGATRANAHLIVLYNRICKLLFYKIKPVFVFDGAAPELKKQTLAARRKRKELAVARSNRATERILRNYLKTHALHTVASHSGSGSTSKKPVLPNFSSKSKNEDMFRLPPLPENESYRAMRSQVHLDDQYDRRIKQQSEFESQFDDPEEIDMNDDFFRNLPMEIQHEIITGMKEKRKKNSWARLHQLPKKSEDFSDYQLNRLLKKGQMSHRLDELQKEMQSKSSGDLAAVLDYESRLQVFEAGRVVSEDARHFVLIKNISEKEKGGEESKAFLENEDATSVHELAQTSVAVSSSVQCDLLESDEEIEVVVGSGLDKRKTASMQKEIESQVKTFFSPNKDETRKKMMESQEGDNQVIELGDLIDVGKEDSEYFERRLSKESIVKDRDALTSDICNQSGKNESSSTSINDIHDGNLSDCHRADGLYSLTNKSTLDEDKEVQDGDEEGHTVNPRGPELDDNGEVGGSGLKSPQRRLASQGDASVGEDQKMKNLSLIEMLKKKKEEQLKKFSSFEVDLLQEEGVGGAEDLAEIEVPKINLETDFSFKGENDVESRSGVNELKKLSFVSAIENEKVEGSEDVVARSGSKDADKEFDKVQDSGGFIHHKEPEDCSNHGEDIMNSQQELMNIQIANEPSEIGDTSAIYVAGEKGKVHEDRGDSVEECEADATDEDTWAAEEEHIGAREEEHIGVAEDKHMEGAEDDIIEVVLDPAALVDNDELFPPSVFKTTVPSQDQEEERQQEECEEEERQEEEDQEDEPREDLDFRAFANLEVDLAAERFNLEAERGRQEKLTSTVTDAMFAETKELLHLFGIPYIVSPQEAEAQCAYLDLTNQTSGTITEDGDVWLFGGKRVYKNMYTKDKEVLYYTSALIEKMLYLDRVKLINLALLMGSDYTLGIQGVGYVTALEILTEFPGDGTKGLKEFRKWWDSVQDSITVPEDTTLRTKLKKLWLHAGFPNDIVVDAYQMPHVDESQEKFSWGVPDFESLREFAMEKFGWARAKVDELLNPVQKKMKEKVTQGRINSYFFLQPNLGEPTTIISERVKKVLKKLSKQEYGEDSSDASEDNSEAKRRKKGKGKVSKKIKDSEGDSNEIRGKDKSGDKKDLEAQRQEEEGKQDGGEGENKGMKGTKRKQDSKEVYQVGGNKVKKTLKSNAQSARKRRELKVMDACKDEDSGDEDKERFGHLYKKGQGGVGEKNKMNRRGGKSVRGQGKRSGLSSGKSPALPLLQDQKEFELDEDDLVMMALQRSRRPSRRQVNYSENIGGNEEDNSQDSGVEDVEQERQDENEVVEAVVVNQRKGKFMGTLRGKGRKGLKGKQIAKKDVSVAKWTGPCLSESSSSEDE